MLKSKSQRREVMQVITRRVKTGELGQQVSHPIPNLPHDCGKEKDEAICHPANVAQSKIPSSILRHILPL